MTVIWHTLMNPLGGLFLMLFPDLCLLETES